MRINVEYFGGCICNAGLEASSTQVRIVECSFVGGGEGGGSGLVHYNLKESRDLYENGLTMAIFNASFKKFQQLLGPSSAQILVSVGQKALSPSSAR